MNTKIIFNTFLICVFMAVVPVICSCSDSDDAENGSNEAGKLVGGWGSGNISFLLYDDGMMSYDDNRKYKWAYNEATGILSTDALYRSQNLQWQVTLLDTASWSGIQLYGDKNTMTFSRCAPRSAALAVLKGRKFINSLDNSIWTCDYLSGGTGLRSWYQLRLNSYDGKEDFVILYNYDYQTIIESREEDKITIVESMKNRDEHNEIVIEHPYSYKRLHVICTFRDGRKTPYARLDLRTAD